MNTTSSDKCFFVLQKCVKASQVPDEQVARVRTVGKYSRGVHHFFHDVRLSASLPTHISGKPVAQERFFARVGKS